MFGLPDYSRRVTGALVVGLMLHAELARAGSMLLLGAGGVGGPPSFGFIPEYDSGFQPEATTTATFSSVPIGLASANRRILVCFTGQGSALSGVTIGGVSATTVGTASSYATLYQASVPTGTTATISFTLPFANVDVDIQVGALYTTTPTPANTQANVVNANFYSSPVSVSNALTIGAGQVGVICGGTQNATESSPSFSLSSGTLDYLANDTNTFASSSHNWQSFLAHYTTSGSWAPTLTVDSLASVGVGATGASWGP
jgi:hypothetical protein